MDSGTTESNPTKYTFGFCYKRDILNPGMLGPVGRVRRAPPLKTGPHDYCGPNHHHRQEGHSSPMRFVDIPRQRDRMPSPAPHIPIKAAQSRGSSCDSMPPGVLSPWNRSGKIGPTIPTRATAESASPPQRRSSMTRKATNNPNRAAPHIPSIATLFAGKKISVWTI